MSGVGCSCRTSSSSGTTRCSSRSTPAACEPMGVEEDARAAHTAAITELTAAHARTEQLAEFVPPHRRMLIPRPASFRRIAPVWRVGALLLTDTGDLFATGSVTRARNPKHPNYTSISGEERQRLREAARKAGYGEHDTVNFDALPLPLDATLGTVGPLVLGDGALLISWNGTRTSDSLVAFENYLGERVDPLVPPPQGA